MLSSNLRRLRARPEHGFTLVELLVSMILLSAVGVAWSGLLTTTVRTGGRTQELAGLQTDVRAAVDGLASNLRQAQCNGTTNPATPPVTAATGTLLTFYSPDRASPYHLRQVSYRLAGGELDRALATSTNTGGPPWTIPSLGPWSKLIGSVSNTTAFTYRDSNGTTTTDPAAVASVNVALSVAPHKGLGGASTSYQTNIDLRTATCP